MTLRETTKQALQVFGFYRHRLQRSPYPGVAVLAYHGVRDDQLPPGSVCFEALHVTASRLASHCECLRALGCSPLSLEDWQEIARGARRLPPRAVLMTFDDGYRNVLTCGLPVLERYGIPAVVFVCTRPVEKQVRFWFDAVAARYGEDAVERAKGLDYAEWRELSDRSEMPAAADDPLAPLTVGELQRLAAHPLIAIGAHTASHPILSRSAAVAQRDEIDESRTALEGWIGRPPSAFAYPNGRPLVDFTPETTALVAASGFTHAFTTHAGFADPVATPFEHPRFLMLDSVDASELAHRLSMSWPREKAGVPCPAV